MAVSCSRWDKGPILEGEPLSGRERALVSSLTLLRSGCETELCRWTCFRVSQLIAVQGVLSGVTLEVKQLTPYFWDNYWRGSSNPGQTNRARF